MATDPVEPRNFPAGHDLHVSADWRGSSLYFPAAHESQSPALEISAFVPNFPTGQAEQPSSPVAAKPVPYVPIGHGSHADSSV